ncbi:hypothetical protein RchiOBHm_Chr6g0290031 [Rosa chinensis]|uniref:Uncharacterized protein n=1 Tax=Rosa chinensis TaxID=74649 RepID=A0A2P6PVS8_ROSCH|nr:hypothetical protein RchiOBHm_Chr6g0290031 [Rosa chinensis]
MPMLAYDDLGRYDAIQYLMHNIRPLCIKILSLQNLAEQVSIITIYKTSTNSCLFRRIRFLLSTSINLLFLYPVPVFICKTSMGKEHIFMLCFKRLIPYQFLLGTSTNLLFLYLVPIFICKTSMGKEHTFMSCFKRFTLYQFLLSTSTNLLFLYLVPIFICKTSMGKEHIFIYVMF